MPRRVPPQVVVALAALPDMDEGVVCGRRGDVLYYCERQRSPRLAASMLAKEGHRQADTQKRG